MEKLTEFVTNSFTESPEIRFIHKSPSSPKAEPLSPARSNRSSGSGMDMDTDHHQHHHHRSELLLINNNEGTNKLLKGMFNLSILINKVGKLNRRKLR